jgi:hypothetical protein
LRVDPLAPTAERPVLIVGAGPTGMALEVWLTRLEVAVGSSIALKDRERHDELHVDIEDADVLLVFPLKGAGSSRVVGLVHGSEKPDRAVTFDNVKC